MEVNPRTLTPSLITPHAFASTPPILKPSYVGSLSHAFLPSFSLLTTSIPTSLLLTAALRKTAHLKISLLMPFNYRIGCLPLKASSPYYGPLGVRSAWPPIEPPLISIPRIRGQMIP